MQRKKPLLSYFFCYNIDLDAEFHMLFEVKL